MHDGRVGEEWRGIHSSPVTTIQEETANKRHGQGRSDKHCPGRAQRNVNLIEAYDIGTFLEAQQPTRDNHGAMGEDSHGRVEGRWDRGQELRCLACTASRHPLTLESLSLPWAGLTFEIEA